MDFPQSGFQVRWDLRTHLTSAHLRKKISSFFGFLSFHTARVKFGRSARFGLDGSLCLDSFRARRTKAKTQVGPLGDICSAANRPSI
jgi:hypothetical protein